MRDLMRAAIQFGAELTIIVCQHVIEAVRDDRPDADRPLPAERMLPDIPNPDGHTRQLIIGGHEWRVPNHTWSSTN